MPLCSVPAAPDVAQIDQGVQWALKESAAGRPVYVHCAHGEGGGGGSGVKSDRRVRGEE